jgi:hypothetical protein
LKRMVEAKETSRGMLPMDLDSQEKQFDALK